MQRAGRILKTIPASIFKSGGARTDSTRATVESMKTSLENGIEARIALLRAEHASAREADRAAHASARAADRAEHASARAADRAEHASARAANRALIEDNRAEIEKLKKWRDSRDFILTFRERSRIVLRFFSAIYKTWAEKSPKYKSTTGKGTKFNIATQLQNDYEEDPNKSTAAKERKKRAHEFLETMWSNFNGTDINLATWRTFLHFVKTTNAVCHTLVALSDNNNVGKVIDRESEATTDERIDRDVAVRLLKAITPVLVIFGEGQNKGWPQDFANETALRNERRFYDFPHWWPR